MKILLLSILLLISINISAQTKNYIDSLEAVVNNNISDSAVLNACTQIGKYSPDAKQVVKYSNHAIILGLKLKDTLSIIKNYDYLGWAYSNQQDLDSALLSYENSYQLSEKINDKYHEAISLMGLGTIYHAKKENMPMLDSYNKCVSLFIELNDTTNLLMLYETLASIYKESGLYKKSYEYLYLGLQYAIEKNDTTTMAQFYLSLTKSLIAQYSFMDPKIKKSKYQIALNYCEKAKSLLKNKNIEKTTLEIYILLSEIFNSYIELDNNISNLDSSSYYLKIINDNIDKLTTPELKILYNVELARNYNFKNKPKEAINALNSVADLNKDVTSLSLNVLYYYSLARSYEPLKIYEKARDNYMTFMKLYRQQISTYMTSTIAEIQFQISFENEKKHAAIEKQKIEEQLSHSQKEFHFRILISIIIIVLVGFVLIILLRLYYTKQQANKCLNLMNQELLSQNEVINRQKDSIEQSVFQINESLLYAKRIQEAVLSTEAELKALYPDSFVLYKPRECVSGDFYLIKKIGDTNIIIEADCTGHGIPGGFLSMLSISALRDILSNSSQNIISPAKILNQIREFIVSVMVDKDNNNCRISDGMDMTICAITNYKMLFAGANQNIVIGNKNQTIRYKGNRMPVGRYFTEIKEFDEQLIEINSGDMVYIYSDGIADQLGGVSKKKFSHRQLEIFFKENNQLLCQIQKEKIINSINQWMKGIFQVDDITLIGFRIN
ncbi:MAG: SpoIIE family protein phosphatase [Bacteroidales bacterium]|nr:SpoIIE family protein phosphatase [Bacteroidales bacterium]